MHAIRRLSVAMVTLGSLLVLAGRANAYTAGTGTASVTVDLSIPFKVTTISATFDSATYDFGVNMGSVGTVSATNVTLTSANIFTGAAFDIPFSTTGNSFEAVGDIACPSGGCLVPTSGPYAYVGFLRNVNVSVLPADIVYTFDGTVTCTGTTIITCTGPFVVNAFAPDLVSTGPFVEVDRSVAFIDSSTGSERMFDARVILHGVTGGVTMLSIAGLSRYRGGLPSGTVPSSDGFSALFFSVDTDATFVTASVCVKVDENGDGVVDGTTLSVSQLVMGLEVGTHGAFGAETVSFPPGGYICLDNLTQLFSVTGRRADGALFVLVPKTPPPTTTSTTSSSTTITTVPGGGGSTTTTIATGSTTSTTLAPCATARACLIAATSKPLCAETINPKLQKTITKKLNVATTKLGKAAAASGAKAARFQKQARAAISAIDTQADKFVNKKSGAISAACRDSIRSALAPVLGKIDASEF